MMKKTVLSSVLCLLLLAAMLMTTACNNGGGKTPQITTPPANNGGGGNVEVEDLTQYYPKADMDGREFVSLFQGTTGNWKELGNTGEPISDIHYARKLAFEEWYDVEYKEQGVSNVVQSLQTAQMSDISYDFVSTHPTEGITTILTKGLCADLLPIESMTLEKEWFSQSFIENYTYNGKLFIVAHDGTIAGQGFYGLAFNKALYAKYDLEYDIYDLVRKGEWTVEILKNIVTETSSSTNAEEGTTYGLLFNLLAAQRWMWAFDGQILNKNEDGSYSLGMTAKKMDPMVSALSDLIYKSGNVLAESYGNAGFLASGVYQNFSSGHGIFVTWDLGNLYNYLRDIEFEVGYAPLPKLTKSQSDYAVISPAGFEGIPSCAANVEESGVFFQFYALYSHINLKPVFFETVLGGRLSDYPEDYEVLNLLHSKKVYDLGYTLDGDKNIAVSLFEGLLSTEGSAASVAVKIKSIQKHLNYLKDVANGVEVE